MRSGVTKDSQQRKASSADLVCLPLPECEMVKQEWGRASGGGGNFKWRHGGGVWVGQGKFGPGGVGNSPYSPSSSKGVCQSLVACAHQCGGAGWYGKGKVGLED